MLNRAAGKGYGDLCQQGFALIAFTIENTNLDEFMGLQGAVDFLQYRSAQAFLADADNGIEGVGTRAQRAAQGGS